MLELADRLLPLLRAGERVALATAIDVVGGSPNPVGSSLALTADGALHGAVSGGCVEDAALLACRALLAGGPPSVTRHGFGDPAGAGCGGEVDVLVHLLDPAARPALETAAARAGAEVALVTAGPVELLGRVATPTSSARASRIFVDTVAAAPHLVITGATETAVALAAAAVAAGHLVTVVDPRRAFVQQERFPDATVVAARPHELLGALRLGPRDAVCLLSHDEELDALTLAAALESGAGYVGALGSRATAARRRSRLALLGVPWQAIARLRAPIGLDLGARAPASTAVSILAEVLAVGAGAAGGALRDREGPVHRDQSVRPAQISARAVAASSCSSATSPTDAVLGALPNTQTVPIR